MKKIKISLSEDEALVLFERLARLDDTGSLPAEDHAEELVFWKLQAQLEKSVVKAFSSDYREMVEDAKYRIEQNE